MWASLSVITESESAVVVDAPSSPIPDLPDVPSFAEFDGEGVGLGVVAETAPDALPTAAVAEAVVVVEVVVVVVGATMVDCI